MSAAPQTRREEASAARLGPGRTCPLWYRYSPTVFRRDPEIVADTIYVIGGLYGNLEALECALALAAREPRPPRLVFNGDFHWFDVSCDDFARVTREVLGHVALRGNVETEIGSEDTGAGCGCGACATVAAGAVTFEIPETRKRTLISIRPSTQTADATPGLSSNATV